MDDSLSEKDPSNIDETVQTISPRSVMPETEYENQTAGLEFEEVDLSEQHASLEQNLLDIQDLIEVALNLENTPRNKTFHQKAIDTTDTTGTMAMVNDEINDYDDQNRRKSELMFGSG